MRRYLLAVSPLLVISLTSSASAQQKIYLQALEPAAVVRATSNAASRPVPSAASRSAESSKEAKSDRLQAFEALKIDRRPSQLLEKWADIEKDAAAPEAPSPLRGEMLRVGWLIRQANWNGLGDYLKGLKEQDEAEAIYRSLLTKLDQQPTSNAPQNPAGQQFPEMQRLTPDDVWGVLTIAPMPHDDESLQGLAGLLTKSLAGGAVIDGFLATMEANAGPDQPAQVEPGAEAVAENHPLTRRQAAKLLQKAGMGQHADRFLPSMEEAVAADDGEALNLLAAHYLTRRDPESRTANLELAWKATQAVLASEKIESEDQLEALRRAVELSSRVRAELGKVWLEESFTTDPARGARILASVGSLASQGLAMQPSASHARLENLKLLSTAVEALLTRSPELGESWRDTLDLLATPWLREAELARQFDSTYSRGPMMRYDSYGNVYYADEQMMMAMQQQRQEQPQAIASGELLKVRPSDAWIALLDESVRPRFAETTARLHLKINEADEAFPYIEQLAKENPEVAEGLVNEFLRVWATNHDPNSERRYMSPIYSLYGYSQRAEGIPLTRSKQVRNLEELAEWVRRLRALPLKGDLDERLLVNAFTTAHSAAEVYDVESIRAVFGDLEGLDPIVLAGLAQQMRGNLAGLWRKPAVQEQSGTNRRKQDIEAEVRRGYQVAGSFLDDALARHPGNWALLTARAAIAHDEADYVNELAKSPEYAERRLAAIASLREAAAAYAASYDENKQQDESVEAYETWFHASMGACDLAGLAPEKLPLEGEAAKIREAILALPGEAAERHMAKFANGLFTGLRSVNPAVKYRYLKHGFEIVEDHPQAVEAKKAFDYYADLVTEIELRATVDGPAEVGHGEPFGIFVNLRHTKEIERESGGFGRYLQNQNNVQYSYNYGRPTENYRDKFEEGVREALADSFEVLSVTFEAEDVTSKADAEYGWRVTPYAYLLVKAIRPEIDRIPPMKLDLDFLDNSGYVVLPVETPMVPIDAGSPADEPRPATVLSVVQTLDERQSRDGKLLLEIKATARGLAPDLDRLVKLEPERFEIDSVEDQGVSVSRFDPDASDTAVVSERLWTISLRGTTSADGPPKEFRFAEPLVDVEEVLYQRYNDADLESVEAVVPLASAYGETDRRRIWIWAGLGAVGVVIAAGAAFYATRKRKEEARVRSRLPETLTPLNVLALLHDARESDRLSAERRKELDGEIARLERDWYSPGGEHRADLKAIAQRWVEFA